MLTHLPYGLLNQISGRLGARIDIQSPPLRAKMGVRVPDQTASKEAIMQHALQGLRDCLALLDSVQAPADIGAHIDLGINRLEEHIQAFEHAVPVTMITRLQRAR